MAQAAQYDTLQSVTVESVADVGPRGGQDVSDSEADERRLGSTRRAVWSRRALSATAAAFCVGAAALGWSGTRHAAPAVAPVDATVGLQEVLAAAPSPPTVSQELFGSALDEFSAFDTDEDGVVSLAGENLSFSDFGRMTSEDKQETIAKHGPENTAVEEEVTLAREELNRTAVVVDDGAPLRPTYRPTPQGRAIAVELYTFGAPATTQKGVYNPAAPGGCFPGLRIATQTRHFEVGTDNFRVKTDPVPSILDFAYKHALMDYMSAWQGNDKSNNITDCMFFFGEQARLKDTPKWDNFWWLNGHMIYPGVLRFQAEAPHNAPKYVGSPDDLPLMDRRLDAAPPSASNAAVFSKPYYDLTTQEKVQRAALMAHLTFLTYFLPHQIDMDTPKIGWTFVGIANAATDEGAASGLVGMEIGSVVADSNAGNLLQTVDSFTDGFGDHAILMQHKTTLQCVLSFEGSNLKDVKDWLSNLDFFSKDFCGFGQTHLGFRAKLYRMLGGIDYRQSIHRQLSGCSSITVTGHSLGGAQAELFAACANNALEHGQPGYIDSRLFVMPKGEPRPLVSWFSDKAPGYFIKNRGNNFCIDVAGTAQTTYRSRVLFYPCETPTSAFSLDQQWEFQPDGFVVSVLNSLCLDGNVTGTAPKIWSCQRDLASTYQKWKLTPEGFLRNLKSGRCLLGEAMKLGKCPYSDQEWKITPSGAMQNLLSGKCLGSFTGAMVGQPLALAECDDGGEGAPRWQLSEKGELMEMNSGLCAVAHYTTGQEAKPTLNFGPCNAWNAIAWEMGEDATVRNVDTERCLNVAGLPGTKDNALISITSCISTVLYSSGIWGLDARNFVVNIGHGEKSAYKCLEIFGRPFLDADKSAEGALVHLDFCKVNTDQKWEFTDEGFIRNVIGAQKCLTIVDNTNSPDPPSPRLWIDNCIDPHDPALFTAMKWQKQGNQLLNKFSQKCMAWSSPEDVDAKHTSPMGGEVVLPLSCSNTAKEYSGWEFRNGTIVSTENGQCLSSSYVGFKNPPLLLANCMAGDQQQQWELLPAGYLRNKLNGKCASNFLSSTAPEQMFVAMRRCPDGGHQVWEALPTGQIRNKAAQKCLDAPLPEQPGLKFFHITLNDCDAQRTTQLWWRELRPRTIVDR
mmetsp:Transcript_79081/g.256450  ORF Transcript_79081/g.256450 Transcript_79081/m.256450 type:complete len:1131 (-) Transcript_79081:128-3520(-)